MTWRDLNNLDFTRVSQRDALRISLERRLRTPKGGIAYQADYGFGLLEWLQMDWDELTESQFITAAQNELERDPRVLEVAVSITEKSLTSIHLRVTAVLLDETTLALEV